MRRDGWRGERGEPRRERQAARRHTLDSRFTSCLIAVAVAVAVTHVAAMGKSLKRRKLREARAEAEAASAGASSSAPYPRSAPLPPALLPDTTTAEPPSDADVAAALRVVGFVGANPHLFAERRYRPLRAALHPLVLEQLKRYEPVDYAARVTSALQAQRWEDGLRALRGLRRRAVDSDLASMHDVTKLLQAPPEPASKPPPPPPSSTVAPAVPVVMGEASPAHTAEAPSAMEV